MIALIPARGGSKRIPGKNIRPLAGHPLLAYTIAAARATNDIFDDGIYVSTDDRQAAEIAVGYGANVIHRDPKHATDTSPDIDWVTAALDYRSPDLASFAILRPTSPFRGAAHIQAAYTQFCDGSTKFDSIRAMSPVAQHPGKMWMFPQSEYMTPLDDHRCPPPSGPRGDYRWNQPTQNLEPMYVQNASLEMAWADTVRVGKSISGSRVAGYLMDADDWASLDLNTERDWLLAEVAIERGLAHLPEII